MTREDAIKELQSYAEHSWGDLNDAFEMAISALRQQEHFRDITKKVEPLTNAQKIRVMSDEELAEAIISIPMCVGTDDDKDCEKDGCKDCFLNWLQKPAKEDDHA